MNALSLFDGISCGQVALERAGIKINNYYASEIDNKAINVTQKNHPNTIQLGDVTKWKEWNLPQIDLLIGGSPCQGFSTSGHMLNFDDPRSKLFFEYVKILNHIKPKYFLLENVKMKPEWVKVISQHLGVEPIEIDSALVSAQSRKRLYWTNIPDIIQPQDKNIKLTDILEDTTYFNSAAIRTRKLIKENNRKSLCLEVNDRNKALCLLTVNLNNIITSLSKGQYPDVNSHNYPKRVYTEKEMCRLQTLPDDYVEGYSINEAAKLLGNAWTVDVITHILEYINIAESNIEKIA